MPAKFNYLRLQKSARRLIDRFGSPITVVITNDIPAANSWEPAIRQTIRKAGEGVKVNTEDKYVNGTLVRSTSQKFLFFIESGTIEPDLAGYIEQNGQKWQFKSVKSIAPADTLIVYSAEVVQ